MPSSVSVVILTFNEELNLPAALDSVKGWAKEVFVVDSYSTDKTVDIALSRADEGVHVVQHEFKDYSAQWNWALTKLPFTSDWTLKLDADERVTEAFKKESAETLDDLGEDVHGVLFRRKLFFMDQPLSYGGIKSNYDLRMWRTGKARFEDRSVNEHALVEGGIHSYRSMVEHHDYKSITDWLEKHNRYSSMEAINFLDGNFDGEVPLRLLGSPVERRAWLRQFVRHVPLRYFVQFFYRYFFQLGILDGLAGFRFAFLHTSYFYWIDLKILDAQLRQQRPAVVFPSRGDPHPVVQHSQLQQQLDERGPKTAAA